MDPVTFRPIGVVRTPFSDIVGMPVHPTSAIGVRGRIELDPAFAAGLADVDGFSHLVLLYHLHEVGAARLTVTPFLDVRSHGIFATRSPARPNPIGMSTVRVVAVGETSIDIEDVDLLDGTPLLDMKPYVPALDDRPGARIGWYEGRLEGLSEARSDDRFSGETSGR
jgi:tRNA (adenine37-N6)-methyltransferase